MKDIEIKPEIVKAIKNRALALEGMNLQLPHDKRMTVMKIIERHIDSVKAELQAERDSLS